MFNSLDIRLVGQMLYEGEEVAHRLDVVVVHTLDVVVVHTLVVVVVHTLVETELVGEASSDGRDTDSQTGVVLEVASLDVLDIDSLDALMGEVGVLQWGGSKTWHVLYGFCSMFVQMLDPHKLPTQVELQGLKADLLHPTLDSGDWLPYRSWNKYSLW
jgi:hypothetical protein